MMVTVPPPGGNKGSRLAAPPPPPKEAPANMAVPNGDKLADMNFKVSPSLKNRVKVEASLRGLSMKDMVEAAFRCYFATYPMNVTIKQDDLF